MQRFIAAYRVLFGLLSLAAVVFNLVALLRAAPTAGSVINYFSYFTILSNVIGLTVLLYCGLTGRHADYWRGAATIYLAVTGLVYALLLAGLPLGLTAPWINTVLHRIMPIVMITDWLLVSTAVRLPIRETLWWLSFPLVYLTYSLIRGAITGWYPYPFLNPAKVGGYGGVAAYCLGITVLFVVLVACVTWFGNRWLRAGEQQDDLVA